MSSTRINARVNGECAVVIGAGLSGLLAARALSETYTRVVVLERDMLPAVGQSRKGVPQGNHAHLMLASGLRALEQLLPGLPDELIAAGAQIGKAFSEIRLVVAGHEITREARGADVLLASRPLLEGLVRRRVLALANVAVHDAFEATDLIASSDGRRVTGILGARRAARAEQEAIWADLVVAASGRGALVPAFLDRLGYARPAEDRLDVQLRYVSRRVQLPDGGLGHDKLVGIGARPGLPRGVWLIAQEDHWIATAFGYGAEHHPPTDAHGFIQFVASVAPPDVLAAVRNSVPLGDLVSHAFPTNLRRRYERQSSFPEGLLVIGDAICSFNPLYGQGMSVAALESLAVRRCLEEGPDRLAQRFFRAVEKVVTPAWELAIGADLALPEVAGRRSMLLRLTNAYVDRLLRAAEHDPVVAEAFNDVSDLLAPPESILNPRILWRVLRDNLRSRHVSDPTATKADVHFAR